MNIVFATSDLYSRLAAVTLQSLLENNQDAESIQIYYIHHDISAENEEMLQTLVDRYDRNIIFLPMPLKLCNIPSIGLKDPIVYSYCYLQDILPDTVDKVLLIESDTIVMGRLQPLYDTKLGDCYAAATDDMQSGIFKKRLKMKTDSVYINSGVMLLNLRKCREQHLSDKMDKMLANGKHELFYEVQDELNIIFEGKIVVLPPTYNATTSLFLFDYKNMLRYRKPSTKCSRKEFDEAVSKPIIVHFTTNRIIQPRPWIVGCTHPFTSEYMRFKQESPSADMQLWPEKQKPTGQVARFLYMRVSKRLVASVVGFLHAILHPLFLYKYLK